MIWASWDWERVKPGDETAMVPHRAPEHTWWGANCRTIKPSWLEVTSHHIDLLLVPQGGFCLFSFPSHQGAFLCSPSQSTSAPFALCHRKWECGIKQEKWSLVKASHSSSHGLVYFTHRVVHHISMASPALWPFSGLLTQQRGYLHCRHISVSEITLPAKSGQSTASQGIPDTRGCSVL